MNVVAGRSGSVIYGQNGLGRAVQLRAPDRTPRARRSNPSPTDTPRKEALRDYRRASGIDARLAVVGMVSNGFSIADPADGGMLDVVAFDTATPLRQVGVAKPRKEEPPMSRDQTEYEFHAEDEASF